MTVVRTSFQHNDMRDTGSDEAKSTIQETLDKLLTMTAIFGRLKPAADHDRPLVLSLPIADRAQLIDASF